MSGLEIQQLLYLLRWRRLPLKGALTFPVQSLATSCANGMTNAHRSPSQLLTGTLRDNSLPSPAQQANNFITLLGGRLSSPGDWFEVHAHLRPNQSHENIYGLLGMKTGNAKSKDFRFLISALVEQGILNADERDAIILTIRKFRRACH